MSAARTGGGPGSAVGYVHDALLYDDPGQLVDVVAPFLREGLAAGEAAVLATGARVAGVVRDALDDDPRLLVLDRAEAYRTRTPATITGFRRLADRQVAEGVSRVRVVGETDFGTTAQERYEWQRYEAVVNVALADRPLWGLCVFDTRRLPEPVLESARRTHPHLVTPRGRVRNGGYVDPAVFLRDLPAPPEPLEQGTPRLTARDVTDFIGLRHAVAAELATLPGPRDVVEDLLLAVDEMTSNAVRHGRPPVDLELWTDAGRVVCRITDRGPGPADPFAGYGPAHGEDLSRGGMGLWLARQLCDHVHVARTAEATSVRLVTRLR
ncbi:Anti-sigma regulatory factor (Ser/Thr protein kinase) [Geodermatophilus saharensis]|uniref:Anti-sigma regulatory factor (Ser/Thr protein kinase) n=1 Tax=Geodermatophilus saharensis TaxID=1137994 RepID=A0A239DHE7_9ACTN|nr:sensor histidine kinase [Geodermatophilus saharensis]SNS31836.1 Anti-sigma regulatory factor (Ser/Thr protein kinase) [Geodermatophilus saharensis]